MATETEAERTARALEICKQRKASIRWGQDGLCYVSVANGFAVQTAYSDPVEALLAAEGALAEAQRIADEVAATRMIEGLAGGEYFVYPESGRNGLSWHVRRSSDMATTVGEPHTGVRAALLAICDLAAQEALKERSRARVEQRGGAAGSKEAKTEF